MRENKYYLHQYNNYDYGYLYDYDYEYDYGKEVNMVPDVAYLKDYIMQLNYMHYQHINHKEG